MLAPTRSSSGGGQDVAVNNADIRRRGAITSFSTAAREYLVQTNLFRHGIQANATTPRCVAPGLTRPLVEDGAFPEWCAAEPPPDGVGELST